MAVSLTKDYIDFGISLKELHDNLLRDYHSDVQSIVVALSRKGPKILETIFSEKELANFDVITEIALPFFFLMRKHQKNAYNIYIVDDAVYYGSTLLNLYRELMEYGEVLGMKLNIQAYVAIKDRGSLQIGDFQLKGMEKIREGYGHFFVKEVMKRFRKLHKCMEIEYPIVDYHFSQAVGINELEKAVGAHFADYYRICHPEGDSLCTLLPTNGCQFSKLRIYPDEHKVSVAVMSPWNIPDEKIVTSALMENMGNGYDIIWQTVIAALQSPDGLKLSIEAQRNIRRSLVVLANYIFSYQVYLYYMRTIDEVFYDCRLVFSNKGINYRDLYQLTGCRELVDRIKAAIDYQTNLIDIRVPSLPKAVQETRLVYEEDDFPDSEERQSILLHNEHMVRNSHSFQEALSALFFNQNLFVERWSRMKARFDGRRLWFGYTHDTLLYQLLRNGRFLKPDNMLRSLHHWVDKGIDQGCVVPQYVLDKQADQWIRVLRPGENEDMLLSHLARFIIHIFKLVESHMGLGYVPMDFLQGMLAVVYNKLWINDLINEFEFNLILDKDRLLRISEFDAPGGPEVINYLKRMYVLEENDGELTISPRITDQEFQTQTTLDADDLRLVDKFVNEVMMQFTSRNIPYFNYEGVFNHYLNSYLDAEDLSQVAHRVCDILRKAIDIIEDTIPSEGQFFVDEECEDYLLNAYHEVMLYDENLSFYFSGKLIPTDLYRKKYVSDKKFRVQSEFKQIIYLINILITVFIIKDFEEFKEFALEQDGNEYLDILSVNDVRQIVLNICMEGSFESAYHNRNLITSIRNKLEEISRL